MNRPDTGLDTKRTEELLERNQAVPISKETLDELRRERDDLVVTLSALADLARTTTRPSNEHAVCRALLDIEGIARAALAKVKGE